MIQLTTDFSRAQLLVSEPAARLGLSNEPTSKSVEANLLKTAQFLQAIKDKLGKPITVLSVYRSPEVNQAVGGSRTSPHTQALAAAIQVAGMTNRELSRFIRENFIFDQLVHAFGEAGWIQVGTPKDSFNRMQLLSVIKVNDKIIYQTGIA